VSELSSNDHEQLYLGSGAWTSVQLYQDTFESLHPMGMIFLA